MSQPSLARRIERTYLTLMLGNTLAGSFIWGINTLFLLDAGLDNFEAFAANAFFTVGTVLFEVPTGIVADTWGRRASYLLGTITLSASTFLYWWLWVVHAPFWEWAGVSMLLGLGFTFFSGAVDAWLVDALAFAGFDGDLEAVFGRGQVVSGVAMLAGSFSGGLLAEATTLGVPFLVRVGVLVAMFAVAFVRMKDLGFAPDRGKRPLGAMRAILRASIEHGWRKPPIRWVMLASLFSSCAAFYAFYAAQPYLLELHGDPDAYSIAGLAAALVAGTQILGGWMAPRIRALFAKRTSTLILAAAVGALALVFLGVTSSLWVAVVLLGVWGFAFAAETPIRQAYLNDMIPSKQRATVLSFDSFVGSSGGIVTQPALGRAADAYGYGVSLALSGALSLLAVPFVIASRREGSPADTAVTKSAPA